MILTPAQQDALVEIANVGAGKAARHLSVLLRDTVQMDVPEVCVGQRRDLPLLLGTAPGDLLVGVRQDAAGMLTAQVSLLFHSEESQQLARELVGTGLPMVGADTRALEHDAMTEIGNIVVSAYVGAFADMLGGNIRLSLATYTEGDLNAVLRHVPNGTSGQESFVLLLKTHMRVMRREVDGSLIVIISRANLGVLTSRIDQWLAGLQSA